MRFFKILLMATFFVPNMALARAYQIDYAQSHVQVSGTHTDKPFTATFEKWEGVIDFDPDALETSKISAVFKPDSLRTGNKMYDGTLPAKDWFNVKAYPEASFESTEITYKEGNVYTARGQLTIRDVTKPISFDFSLSDINIAPIEARAQFDIDRLGFDLGKGSDPAGEWVSKTMAMDLKIIASPQ